MPLKSLGCYAIQNVSLRSGNRSSLDKGSSNDNFGPESMEADHFRRQILFYLQPEGS